MKVKESVPGCDWYFNTRLETFSSSCANIQTAFHQLFALWVKSPINCSSLQILKPLQTFKIVRKVSLVTKSVSMKLAQPFSGLHSSSQYAEQHVHVHLEWYSQDVSVFGKQFIQELQNIFNFPKYILLDPYKRNLSKYNNMKLSLLQVIKYLLPLIYTYKMPHNELVYPWNVCCVLAVSSSSTTWRLNINTLYILYYRQKKKKKIRSFSFC